MTKEQEDQLYDRVKFLETENEVLKKRKAGHSVQAVTNDNLALRTKLMHRNDEIEKLQLALKNKNLLIADLQCKLGGNDGRPRD